MYHSGAEFESAAVTGGARRPSF